MKKRYLLYLTTNLVNGKIYIGKHVTTNIEDSYFGSGTYLLNAINKYGIENFEFKILFELQNDKELSLLEKYVVNELFILEESNYNILIGGDGGNPLLGMSILDISNFKLLCSEKTKAAMTTDIRKFLSEHAKQCHKEHPERYNGLNNGMYNHIYSIETRSKMSMSHLGKKNHSYNKHWYYDPLTYKTMFCYDGLLPKNWIKGRKMKAFI